ncbi:hypothetical protein DYI25_16130 [Mesobacillus boroniphilus]|uniref:Uncharacterized protein n=1 Tax=Mesobacillus boroniphilus TaxID=308892 RepID=A0A944GYW8_9BACI|nr:hypothetical protein [Mesobacillus boroniphilus]
MTGSRCQEEKLSRKGRYYDRFEVLGRKAVRSKSKFRQVRRPKRDADRTRSDFGFSVHFFITEGKK